MKAVTYLWLGFLVQGVFAAIEESKACMTVSREEEAMILAMRAESPDNSGDDHLKMFQAKSTVVLADTAKQGEGDGEVELQEENFEDDANAANSYGRRSTTVVHSRRNIVGGRRTTVVHHRRNIVGGRRTTVVHTRRGPRLLEESTTADKEGEAEELQEEDAPVGEEQEAGQDFENEDVDNKRGLAAVEENSEDDANNANSYGRRSTTVVHSRRNIVGGRRTTVVHSRRTWYGGRRTTVVHTRRGPRLLQENATADKQYDGEGEVEFQEENAAARRRGGTTVVHSRRTWYGGRRTTVVHHRRGYR